MTGREIYSILRCCTHFKITTKVYSDWIMSEKTLVGFVCHVNSNLGKDLKLEKIRLWIAERKLPVEIFDETGHSTRFKAVIKK